jgi:hypothetical protein
VKSSAVISLYWLRNVFKEFNLILEVDSLSTNGVDVSIFVKVILLAWEDVIKVIFDGVVSV